MCSLHSNLRRVRFPDIYGDECQDDLSKSFPRNIFWIWANERASTSEVARHVTDQLVDSKTEF